MGLCLFLAHKLCHTLYPGGAFLKLGMNDGVCKAEVAAVVLVEALCG